MLKRFFFLLLVFPIYFLGSCDKYHAKKLAGNYLCFKVQDIYYGLQPGQPSHTESWDTIEVKSERRDVLVLGYRIPVDSLWKKNTYHVPTGDPHTQLEVKFRKKHLSMVYEYHYLGSGGKITYEGDLME